MAERTLTAALASAIQETVVRPAIIYEGEFVDGEGNPAFVRLWSGIGTISWNGNSWLGVGNLIGLGEVKETTELQANSFEVWLSGVSSSMVALALTSSRKNRSGKVWLGLFEDFAYLSLPSATSGNYVSLPDSAPLSFSGDIDIRVKARLDVWSTATLISKWDTAGNQRSWKLSIAGDGSVFWYWSNDGVAENVDNSFNSVGMPPAGATSWFRITEDVDNGSGNRVLTFLKSDNGVIWTPCGTTPRIFTGTNSFFDSTAPIRIGNSDASFLYTGDIHYAEIRDGIDGTIVATYDPVNSEAWTLNGSNPARLIRIPKLIDTPDLIKQGRFDTIPIDDSGDESRIIARYEDRLAVLDVPKERRYTTQDQSLRDPTDLGFEYVEVLQDSNFVLNESSTS